MTEKKRNVAGAVLFCIIFGALLTLATFYDFQVSSILADLEPGEYLTTNPFGVTFEIIGSWPVQLFVGFAFAIVFANALKWDFKLMKWLGAIIGNAGSVYFMYVLINDTVGYIERHFEVEYYTVTDWFTAVIIVFAIIFGELMCYRCTKFSDEQLKALWRFAFVIFLCAALSNIIVSVIKNIMYRPRYRTMNYFGDFSVYRRWYQKSELPVITDEMRIVFDSSSGKDGYRSFPSGHTSAAGTIYALAALPHLFKKYDTRKWKILLYVISISVTGIVAVSRIVCGAHFFSDVLVGGTLSYLSAVIGIKIFAGRKFQKV